jgi:hypothetical protein
MASVDPCYSCTERMAVVDRATRKRLYTGEDLVRLSEEKTRRMWKEAGR